MRNNPADHKQILKDTGWYLLGTAIPIIVSLLRSPIFTRYFTPEEYRHYSLVLITINILSVFLYTWMSNSIWRFYFKYKKSGRLNAFYPGLLAMHLLATVLFMAVVIPWAGIEGNPLISRLILLVFVQTFQSQLLGFILVIIRLENRSGLYNTIHSIRALLSFGVQALLAFVYNFRIEAIPIASILTEFAILMIILAPILKNISLNFRNLSRSMLIEMGKFAMPGIVTNLSILLLTFSDRYVISIYTDVSRVGIYNQVYTFSQLSILALVNVFFSVINPTYLKALEFEPENVKHHFSTYFKYYLVLVLPFVVWISLYAKPVSVIFFGKDFREGYNIIPWVAFSQFVYGYILFRDNRFKFQNKYRLVIIGFLAAAGLNIGLNFAFIPPFGYKMAAITTFAAYLFLYLYLFLRDDTKLTSDKKYMTIIGRASGFLILQVIIHFAIQWGWRELNLAGSIIEGAVFVMTYGLIILMPQYRTFKRIKN